MRRLDGERYADGYANSKWAGEVLLREAHDRFGLPVSVFRSDMILAHSQYQGQINVPDMFTRWLFSIVVTGLAPRSFYTSGAAKPHYDGLPVDFTADSDRHARRGLRCSGYRTYHVVNPHDDGISMDTFIDWAIEAGYGFKRIDDYDDWYRRFETALRGLPEKQRQHSSLPLLINCVARCRRARAQRSRPSALKRTCAAWQRHSTPVGRSSFASTWTTCGCCGCFEIESRTSRSAPWPSVEERLPCRIAQDVLEKVTHVRPRVDVDVAQEPLGIG